jgi:hypothetical protein
LEGATDPQKLILASAIPSDATLESAAYVERAPKQLVVTWNRERLTRSHAAIWQRRGVAIWQLDRGKGVATWHRVYTFENALTNREGTVWGFRVSTGDISGDGRPEILVFFDRDGSAGAGTYHLFANTGFRLQQPLVKSLSMDEGTISFSRRGLRVNEGIDRHLPATSPHCCFRKVRSTLLRWNGSRLVTIERTVRPNRKIWPPG